MEKDNKLFEDFIKLTGSAMNTAFGSMSDMKKQFDDVVAEKLDNLLKEHNVVTREEFNVVKKMAEKARMEQEKLKKKIAVLEKKNK